MTKSIMLNNIHIISEQPLTSPEQIREEIMVSDTLKEFIFLQRQLISRIIHQQDKRLLVICGPCSIHDSGNGIQ